MFYFLLVMIKILFRSRKFVINERKKKFSSFPFDDKKIDLKKKVI